MFDEESHDTGLPQDIDVAADHLAEAEKVLWELSHNVASPETAENLEDVVEDIWELQNKTSRIQQKLQADNSSFSRSTTSSYFVQSEDFDS